MFRSLVVFLIIAFSSNVSARSLTDEEWATLEHAINTVSAHFQIPLVVLYGVYMQERGWPGAAQDVGSSADLGVFQINNNPNNWLPELERVLGLDGYSIQHSISANTAAAGYILHKEFERTGAWTEAAANYHRHARDSFRDRYQKSVVQYMLTLLERDPSLAMVYGTSSRVRDPNYYSTSQISIVSPES